MVKLLLDNLSPVNAQDRSGLTPLHHAIAEGHGDVAVELLRRGAESGRVDTEGNVPIKLAPDQKVSCVSCVSGGVAKEEEGNMC